MLSALLCSKHDYDYNYLLDRLLHLPILSLAAIDKLHSCKIQYLIFGKPNGFLKLQVNILRATKTNSIYQWTDSVHQWTNSVFMRVIKPSRFLQCTKIESIFAKELQKPNQFLWLLATKTELIFASKLQVDFFSKWVTKSELIFSK